MESQKSGMVRLLSLGSALCWSFKFYVCMIIAWCKVAHDLLKDKKTCEVVEECSHFMYAVFGTTLQML
jgi:hypothetical protein